MRIIGNDITNASYNKSIIFYLPLNFGLDPVNNINTNNPPNPNPTNPIIGIYKFRKSKDCPNGLDARARPSARRSASRPAIHPSRCGWPGYALRSGGHSAQIWAHSQPEYPAPEPATPLS